MAFIGSRSFSIKTLFLKTLTEHLTQVNFNLRNRNNARLTLEMHYLMHLDKTPPRNINFNTLDLYSSVHFNETPSPGFVFSCHLGPKKTWRLFGVRSFTIKHLFLKTLTEQLTRPNFDLRTRNNASWTLEMRYLVHLDKTPPRNINFNGPFTKTSQKDLGVSGHSR